jgi:hypothetical protein
MLDVAIEPLLIRPARRIIRIGNHSIGDRHGAGPDRGPMRQISGRLQFVPMTGKGRETDDAILIRATAHREGQRAGRSVNNLCGEITFIRGRVIGGHGEIICHSRGETADEGREIRAHVIRTRVIAALRAVIKIITRHVRIAACVPSQTDALRLRETNHREAKNQHAQKPHQISRSLLPTEDCPLLSHAIVKSSNESKYSGRGRSVDGGGWNAFLRIRNFPTPGKEEEIDLHAMRRSSNERTVILKAKVAIGEGIGHDDFLEDDLETPGRFFGSV